MSSLLKGDLEGENRPALLPGGYLLGVLEGLKILLRGGLSNEHLEGLLGAIVGLLEAVVGLLGAVAGLLAGLVKATLEGLLKVDFKGLLKLYTVGLA